jgi:hypothetical protein
MPLPVNFEKLVKLPDGNGYPHSIRAVDLMRNFAYCDLLPGSSSESENGLWIELEDTDGETATHPQRRLVVKGESGGLPEGYEPLRVKICVDGVPTDYDILAKPVTE